MVLIYFIMMGLTGYFTFGLQKTICDTKVTGYHPWRHINKNHTFTINNFDGPIVRGYAYTYSQLSTVGINLPNTFNNTNLNSLFLPKTKNGFKSSCKNFVGNGNKCHFLDSKNFDVSCQDIKMLDRLRNIGKIVYTWKDIEDFKKTSIKGLKERPNTDKDLQVFANTKLLVFNGVVLNVTDLLNDSNYSQSISTGMKEKLKFLVGKDATLYFSRLMRYTKNQDMSCILVSFVDGIK